MKFTLATLLHEKKRTYQIMKAPFAAVLGAAAVALITIPSANANTIDYTYQFDAPGAWVDGSTITIEKNSSTVFSLINYNLTYGYLPLTLTPLNSSVNILAITGATTSGWAGYFEVESTSTSDYFSGGSTSLDVYISDWNTLWCSDGAWNFVSSSSVSVPDGGSTALLLGAALSAFGLIRRKLFC